MKLEYLGAPGLGQRMELAPGVRPTLFEYAGHLTPEAPSRDFVALLDCLDGEAEFADGKIGVVGYCMTGAFALRMAAEHPDRVAAAAGFHSARLASADALHHKRLAILLEETL